MKKATGTQGILLILALSAAGSTLAADSTIATPALYGNADGIDRGEDARTELELRELAIDVAAIGALAHVSVDATFGYDDEGFSEGVFEMQLPEGAVVTRYALDVDGAMLDGVLVPQGKARVSFEERVRDEIDAGLAEVSRDNVFATRAPGDSGRSRRRRCACRPRCSGRRRNTATSRPGRASASRSRACPSIAVLHLEVGAWSQEDLVHLRRLVRRFAESRGPTYRTRETGLR